MRIYTAEDLAIEPIVMMTQNENEAISGLHWSILHGLGFWPNLNFTIRARQVNSLPLPDELRQLLAEDTRGFASLSERGWKHVPFKQ